VLRELLLGRVLKTSTFKAALLCSAFFILRTSYIFNRAFETSLVQQQPGERSGT